MYEPPVTLARGDGQLGELVLRRRDSDPPVYELIVNGVFLMDTAETFTERLLADLVLERSAAPRRLLVGGLGLGFTVRALLADARVQRIDAVEIEALLVEWLRAGLVPAATTTLGDHRVHVTVGDIRDALATADAGSYDAVLLDVDNGPGFLVNDSNATVYSAGTLSHAAAALGPHGVLAVWSAAPAEPLQERLAKVVGSCEDVAADVVRDGRAMTYHIYLATTPS